jgi:hypothetical protein
MSPAVRSPHSTRRIRPRITRRAFALVLAAPLLLAACGDDDTQTGSPGPTPGDSTLPPEAPPPTPAPSAYEHPTGSDDVVVWIGVEGGFVPVEVAFQHLPSLLVTGDGRAIQQGPQIAIYPGPLLPNLQQRTITEEGIQQLLGLADEHGLFQPGSYKGPEDTIADAPYTVVRLTADGTTIEHRAYALGIDGDEEGDRARLAEFVALATDLAAAVGEDELGPEEPYESETYRIRATVVDDTSGFDIEPTVVDWPETASVRLTDATQCAVVPVDEVVDLFAEATQLTFFREDGVVYQVSAVPALPGDSC